MNFLRTRSAALGHGRVLSLSGAGWGDSGLGVSVCDRAWLRTASRPMYSDDCTLSAALLSKPDVLHRYIKKCLRPAQSLERV